MRLNDYISREQFAFVPGVHVYNQKDIKGRDWSIYRPYTIDSSSMLDDI